MADQNVISKALKNSAQNTKSGQALAAPVQCPEIARVHFLGCGYTWTDRNSATVGRIFQFRAFLAGFFTFRVATLEARNIFS